MHHQITTLHRGLAEILGPDLAAVYLHGSLAMGCFNPQRSDIDLLVVTHDLLSLSQRRAVYDLLLQVSAAPRPIEISSCSMAQLWPWRYPPPFDLHYGEDWRDRIAAEIADGRWRTWQPAAGGDPDLAAHITIIHERGITISGPPPAELLPPVPRHDYVDSIMTDIAAADEQVYNDPVYIVLNLCRVAAYVQAGLITSKAEGGEWGMRTLSHAQRPVVAEALAIYRGTSDETPFAADALAALVAELQRQIAAAT